MTPRARRLSFAAVGASALLSLASPSVRASVVAAYRAFRDPSLLDAKPLPAREEPVCARTDDGRGALDAKLARDFDRATDEDLDDPDGATLKSLTMPDLHVPITRRTMRFVKLFARSERGRASFQARFRRGAAYHGAIVSALRDAGLPEDLVWLAAIESGFDPRAVSPAGAAGLFQMMPETGALYGLEQTSWVDERRSIARATKAAVTHLRDLYERFHRWDLALAAYNAGFDRVVKGIEMVARPQSGAPPLGRPPEFSDLAAARALPDETIDYVPEVTAFAIVAANRSRFGLDGTELSMGLDLAEIAVPEGTRLRTVARAAAVSIDLLREYNPQLLRDRVPPTGGDYLLSIPADRTSRTLAAFPSYLAQEVIDASEEDAPREASTAGAAVRADGPKRVGDAMAALDDPLPHRPADLGNNRLPAYEPEPAQAADHGAAMEARFVGPDIDLLRAKLPVVAVGLDVGWQPRSVDMFSLFASRAHLKSVDAFERSEALGFLRAPAEPLRATTLPNGIALHVRRDRGAPSVAIAIRVADDASERSHAAPRASFELVDTITVPKADAEIGIEVAAARLRLAIAEASDAHLAELRRRAAAPRRRQLEEAPYGAAWLALGDALFPPGHPIEGTVVGAAEDPDSARDALLAEAFGEERRRAKASLTIAGDIDEARAEKIGAAFLAPLGRPSMRAFGPHPREERITIAAPASSPRMLAGWIAPAEGETGDASLLVAARILSDPKIARLDRMLKTSGDASRAVVARVERASVFAVELAPPARDAADVERKLDALFDAIAGDALTYDEVALAKAIEKARVERDLLPAKPAAGGEVRSASPAHLRAAAHPDAAKKLLAALDDVTRETVKSAVRSTLARDHRVIVWTVPRAIATTE